MTIKTKYTRTHRSPSTAPLMGQYQARLDAAMGMLEGAGTQQRKDLAMRYRAAESGGMQDVVSRGLTGGGVIGSSMRRGYRRDHENQLGRLNESLQRERLGVYGQFSGDLAAAQQSNFWASQQQMMNQQQMGLGYARLNAANRYGYANRSRTRAPSMGMYGMGGQAQFAPRPQGPIGLPQLQQVRAYRRMYQV